MIIIEKVKASDAENMLVFLKRVGGETDNLTFGKEGVPFTVAEEECFLAGFDKSGTNVMFVVKDGEKIVGNANLTRLNGRMGHRANFGISVLKDYWGKGIGSKMLEKIICFAKETQVEVLELEVRSDNLRAIGLYKKFGFEKFAAYPDYYKLNGEYVSFDLMRLKF